MPFTASSGNPLPPSVTPPSPANGHSTPNATRSPTAALLDAEYTPEAKQQGADHPLVFPGLPASQASGVDRQPASVPLSASAASPINTARSADRQPAKPVASPASAQGSGLQAASQPVCTEGCRSFSALKPDADPPLSPAAISQETPTAVVSASSRQQAPAEMTQGTRQQQRTDVVSVGGSKLCVPGDFELADAKQYLQNGSNLFPAADAEAKNVSLASSMRGAQLSGGGQQQGSPKLQTLSSVASVVSSLEGDAGSEVFPQTGLGQERSAVGGDQVGIQTAQAALLFCRIGSRFNVRTCLVLRAYLGLPHLLSFVLICRLSCETQALAPAFWPISLTLAAISQSIQTPHSRPTLGKQSSN